MIEPDTIVSIFVGIATFLVGGTLGAAVAVLAMLWPPRLPPVDGFGDL